MKVPYPMTAAVDYHSRCAQMAQSIAIANERGYPRLQPVPLDDRPDHVMSLACYGPSLEDTWQTLTRPILSMSGATHFLAERGIIPDFHIDMDPRSHKVKHLDPPVAGVHYLMASVCPPETWQILKGQRVSLWHTYSGRDPQSGETTYDWVARHDSCGLPATDPTSRSSLVIHGGSTIGLTAMHLANVMGYRHLEIHGMDGSFKDESLARRHAGVHYGREQKDFTTWNAEGVKYHTSKIMANAVAETINTIKSFPMLCVFHGRGLTQALVREANVPNACTADQVEKAVTVRQMTAQTRDLRMWDRGNMTSLWGHWLANDHAAIWLGECSQIVQESETRRHLARYNTGSVSLETALLLRAICAHTRPNVIVEVGTFIGTSTLALRAEAHLYTCDRDNDCLPSTPTRTCFPYTRATDMFLRLATEKVRADLVFLDGRLKASDVPLLMKVTQPRTVYVLDDFVANQKGIANAKLLAPFISQSHALLQPYEEFRGRTTLAAFLPMKSVA